MLAFTIALLYPLVGLLAPIGHWQWDGSIPGSTTSAVRVSLVLTGIALLLDVILGTPVAWYLARHTGSDCIVWEAAILVSVLMPPLALGILLSLAFGPQTPLGAWLLRAGLLTSNSRLAFASTQVYVSIGYYILAARAALAAVPRDLELLAGLLGLRPAQVFRRVTLPLARLGLAAALSLAWVRALGEFGAVIVTSYYPSGMPVQIWVNLQDAGMPAVMPLLAVFLLTALPLPWLIHLLVQRRSSDA
ncbi:MAG TPA: ABC transporter permease subunit [Candidatus Binataceae bacterium]|jgi:molybdate/tungstate transport system permease protein|nr:ABC transporter permease subunit [Candidatus Binataceae bacterium]